VGPTDAIIKDVRPFLTLCKIFWKTAFSLRHHQTLLSISSQFQYKNMFRPKKTSSRYELLRQTNPMSLPLHVNLSPERHPTAVPSVAQ
jgi:hypothetical protein